MTDTSNIWAKANQWLTRFDQDLLVTFIEEESSPTVRFVPFRNQGDVQRGLKIGPDLSDRASWTELSAGATKDGPITYLVKAVEVGVTAILQ